MGLDGGGGGESNGNGNCGSDGSDGGDGGTFEWTTGKAGVSVSEGGREIWRERKRIGGR